MSLLVVTALLATATPLRAQTVTSLNVLRLKVEKNTRSVAMPNDVIIMKGDFLTQQQPGDGFDLTAGITVQVSDALMLDQTFTFDPSECVTNAAGRSKCLSHAHPWSATFSPAGRNNPTAFKFKAHFKGFLVTPPFLAPVTVTMSQGTAVVRTGDITECAARPKTFLCQQL
jgi:hypothetical protein